MYFACLFLFISYCLNLVFLVLLFGLLQMSCLFSVFLPLLPNNCFVYLSHLPSWFPRKHQEFFMRWSLNFSTETPRSSQAGYYPPPTSPTHTLCFSTNSSPRDLCDFMWLQSQLLYLYRNYDTILAKSRVARRPACLVALYIKQCEHQLFI